MMMEHIVYNPEKSIFRYASGVPVYSERLENGALVMIHYRGHGLPLAEDCRSHTFRPCPSFALELNGCDARYGWELTGFHTETLPDGRAAAV